MRLLHITIISLLIMSSCYGLDPESCDFMEGLRCAATLGEAVKDCKENKDFSKCYNDLQQNKDCIHCTCKVFPQYCSEKTGDIDEKGPTNPFSKVKINKNDTHFIDIRKILLAAVQCDPSLFETCQDKIKKIGAECLINSNKPGLECLKEEIGKTECNVCFCKLLPKMCSEEEKQQIEKQNEQKKKSKSSSSNGFNISDVVLGGLMESGLNSESLKSMFTDGKAKENITKMLSNPDVKNKVKDLLNNESIQDQLKKLVSSNPEEVSKVAQNVAENKSAQKAVQDITEIYVKQEEEKKKAEKKQQEEEEKKSAALECTSKLKSSCQIEFIKIQKKCSTSREGHKPCVHTILSGHRCEPCMCTFIKNVC